MTDEGAREHSLLQRGPSSIIEAVEAERERGGDALNIDILAQACARRSRRHLDDRALHLAWTAATVACYGRAADRREPGFDRQGRELGLYGAIATAILLWGAAPGDPLRDPASVTRWLTELTDELGSPARLGLALKGPEQPRRARALLLRERLLHIKALHARRLLPSWLGPWFAVVEAAPEDS